MQPSSRLVSVVAAFTIVASGPALARVSGSPAMAFMRHMAHAPLPRREAARAGRPLAFDAHRRRGLGTFPIFGAGIYGVPYPVIDDALQPPEAGAAQPPAPQLVRAEAPAPPAPVVGPPALVYAQIGYPDFAPRIIYRHPTKRPSSRHVVVYYGIRQVDRTY